VILGVTGAAIWFTVQGLGPFVFSSRNESLLLLQAFTSTIALLGLVVWAFTRQRRDSVDALQTAREELERTVLERTAELERKNRDLARDIAEKERLAAELRNREAQLAEAQAIAQMGSWTWDVHSDRVTWSSELFRIYGLAPDQFDGSFQGYISCVHPDDRQQVTQTIQDAVEHQRPWELTERIIRPDGSIRVLRSLGKVLTNAAGETTTLYGVCLDDTDRARLEQLQAVQFDVTRSLVQAGGWRDAVLWALRILCQRLGWALGQMWRVDKDADVIRHACAWCEPDTDVESFVEVSKRMTFELGQGLPGRTWQRRQPVWIEDVVVDPNFPRADAARRANLHAGIALPLVAGGEVLGVIELFNRQMLKPEIEVLQMLMALGSQLGEYVVRSESETLLNQSEERFRLLVEAVTDYAIFMLDVDGRVATWNAGAQRIKGYRADEIIGQHFSRFYTAEDVAAGRPASALRAAMAEGHVRSEGWRVRKDGSTFWADVVVTAVHDAAGQLRGFAKVTRDMTDRKRMEALEEGGRQTRQFLAMLGHELRNPLAPIRNAVSIMHAHDVTDPELRRCRDVIERQVAHLSRLVDDLMDAGRIASGKIELRREPVILATALTAAVESSRPVVDARKQDLRVQLPTRPVVVNGDSVRLTQIVQNLLNNSAKFTPVGGRIELTLQTEGNSAVIRVRDNGAGIPPSLLPKVFDLFVQGDRGLDRGDGGLGVGLTLVREIARSHGGSVEAVSAGAGRGTEITVRLPLLGVDAARSAQPRKDATVHSSAPVRRRILVVDDNHDATDSMASLLQLWGHEARCAYDGPSALALAADYSPQIVLLDIGLPGMDGYEVGRKLRELPQMGRAVLIALSGYGQSDDKKRSAQAGFDHHLVKPVDIDTLRPLIERPAA
jgi:PAS domain S-box-containing protein